MKKGFTLVELLAVIVLLGLVSIVAFPRILESMDKTNQKIDQSKMRLLYQGTEKYLAKEENSYPKIEGNTFCIVPKILEEENYISYELGKEVEGNVVRAVVGEEEKISYSYVNQYDCIEKGVIVGNLGKVKCEIEESGYAVSKTVNIQYPVGTGYVYSYSYDGENWSRYEDKEGEGIQRIEFQSGGYVIARVRKEEGGGYQSCTAKVSQIDPKQIGSVVAYAGEDIPKGYLLADGKAVSRKAYSKLYKIIATTYGAGDGATTFNLPNVRGRVIVGQGKSGSYKDIGDTGGEISHILTIDELASHTHAFKGDSVTTGNNSATPSASFKGNSVTTSTVSGHRHSIPNLSGTAASNGTHSHVPNAGNRFLTGFLSQISRQLVYGGEGTNKGYSWTTDNLSSYSALNAQPTVLVGVHTHAVSMNASNTYAGNTPEPHKHTLISSGKVTINNTSHTHSITLKGKNANAGGNKAHNNLMPYQTLKYLIKYQ